MPLILIGGGICIFHMEFFDDSLKSFDIENILQTDPRFGCPGVPAHLRAAFVHGQTDSASPLVGRSEAFMAGDAACLA